MIPIWSGLEPVIRLARDGLQIDCWQYARSNRLPSFANRSIFGDLTIFEP